MAKWFKARGRGNLLPNYIVLTLFATFALVPLIIVGFNSVKSNYEIGLNALGPPREIHLENFPNAWVGGRFGSAVRNSLILVAGTVPCVLLLGGLAAYSLARLNPAGSRAFMVYMLGLSTLPIWIYVIPLFMLWRNIGLLNSLVGLIILYVASRSPFCIFLLRSYMVQLPVELEDAARVDGAGEWTIFARIVLPLLWPAFLTVGLVVAMSVWNEYQLALIFIQKEELLPVTTSYARFMRRFTMNWALTYAGAVMMILPVVAIFLILQRQFIEGLSQGGVKG